MNKKELFNHAYRMARASGLHRQNAEDCANAIVARVQELVKTNLDQIVEEEIRKHYAKNG